MYITLKKFTEVYSWPTMHGLRSMYKLARTEKNKYLNSFRKVGRRLLINPYTLFKTIESNPSTEEKNA